MRVLAVVTILALVSCVFGNKLWKPYEEEAKKIFHQVVDEVKDFKHKMDEKIHDVPGNAMSEREQVIAEHKKLTFEMWKEQFNKEYNTVEEEQSRKNIFLANLDYINNHNDQGHEFYLGMNQFGDMSHDEFKNSILMQAVPAHKPEGGKIYEKPEGFQAKEKVDWRSQGTEDLSLVLDEVKNQGQCGSCWAFSAVGALEGQWQKKTKNDDMVSLSEQDLVDCSSKFGNMGCNGGLMDNAFQYIKSVHGIDTEDDYSYTAKDGSCHEDDEHRTAPVTGFVDIPSGDETALRDATASEGPIAVAIDASQISFQFYRGGVYSPLFCSSTQLDHGVLVVGYGTSEGKDYWIVRNSWGAVWGLKGYIHMVRNKNNKCGIATQASYPTV
eukprot:Nk52_evm33s2340 gene=Nk52_evmTU33s2340